jgi:hypothetical protein
VRAISTLLGERIVNADIWRTLARNIRTESWRERGGAESEGHGTGPRSEREREKREIHLEIVSASVWPLAYWN